MNKKEYIERAKSAILNRVRFHAPITYDSKVDGEILKSFGIDVMRPIFKFDKIINKRLLKAFELAKKEEDFNLVLNSSCLPKLSQHQLKKMGDYIIFDSQRNPIKIVEMINKLNINYQSSSNYNIVFKEKFLKVNDIVLNPKFEDFSLKQEGEIDEVGFKYQEFVLNGTNFFIEFSNASSSNKKISLELNIPLKKGYYYFKKEGKSLSVENLISKEKIFFNFICKNAKFSFSNVDGLENSVFCCINVKLSFILQKKEKKFVFFNLSDSKVCLKNYSEIQQFSLLAKRKTCEIFAVRVKTKNPKFDLFFNQTLPKKIWLNWVDGKVDLSLEEKYLALKKLFVVGSDKICFVTFKEIGLREIGIFNGEYYKKIVVVKSEEKFFKVGKTCFFNINNITQQSLKSKEPIMLSFG